MQQYTCDLCAHRFCLTSDLRSHLNIHTGLCEYTCDICAAFYKRKHNLYGHISRHLQCYTGFGSIRNTTTNQQNKYLRCEKPFKCEICSAAFSTSDHLKRHTRVHTGVRPFKCQICSASFSE